ncbi:Fumarylacetoacetase [Papilio machaon]|uniref:Fumarylacetoacetase n=1 Tax=Papilio machaon TaxID=76193 RepID=A0A0N1IPG5_PAPMA|nr:Fumarylacetoacetase [Papilio machaon]
MAVHKVKTLEKEVQEEISKLGRSNAPTDKHIGVAIGEWILDLNAISHLFNGPLLKDKQHVFKEEKLNSFMGLTKPHWLEARSTIQSLLDVSNSTLQNDTNLRER